MYREMDMGFWLEQVKIDKISSALGAGGYAVLDELTVQAKVSVPFLRLNDLIEHHARLRPDAAAILAPGRAPLSYGGLHQHIGEVGRALRAMGIGREDRVALMLPNGPEMAAAILCVASNAACAVVNPAYASDELERYFDALRLRR